MMLNKHPMFMVQGSRITSADLDTQGVLLELLQLGGQRCKAFAVEPRGRDRRLQRTYHWIQ